MKTYLLLDMGYLTYRSWYSKGDLSYGDLHTSVTFGILQDIVSLQDRFNPDALCFCFDYGRPIREVSYPQYKSARRNKVRSEDEIESFKFFEPQVKALRREYLKQLGYSNILYDKGFEADDVIGQLCLSLSDNYKVQCIIVSADHDLYQLLSKRVSIFKPSKKEMVTVDSFSREYGVSPLQWIDIKAIAGCSSDSIQGIKGVGEITAAKFLNGSLNPDSKTFQKIVAGNKTWQSNRHLVRLPFPGIRDFTVKDDKVTAVSWAVLARKLGVKSLQDRPPIKKKKGFGIE